MEFAKNKTKQNACTFMELHPLDLDRKESAKESIPVCPQASPLLATVSLWDIYVLRLLSVWRSVSW